MYCTFSSFYLIFYNHMYSPLVVSDISQPQNLRLNGRACDLAACERQGKRGSTSDTKRPACATLARWPETASQGCLFAAVRTSSPEDLSSCEDLWP